MASGFLRRVFLDDLKIIEMPMVFREPELIEQSVSLLRSREIAQHQNRLGAFKSWVCSFLACTFLLLPAFASALVEVEFSNGFFGTVGQNTQKADSISIMSDYGVTEIKLQQDLADSASIFQLQGNDIPMDLVLTQGSSDPITIGGSITWVFKNGGKADSFGFILNPDELKTLSFTSDDDPPETISITLDGNSDNSTKTDKDGNLARGEKGDANVGLILNGQTGWTFSTGQDISGSADLKLDDILELLNSYLAVQTGSGASLATTKSLTKVNGATPPTNYLVSNAGLAVAAKHDG